MSRATGRFVRGLGILVGLALLGAGCAIPTQSGPSAIPASHVPFGLLNAQPPPTTTTQPNPSSLVPVKVYFFSSAQQLQAVDRVVVTPASLTSIITSMLAGPSSSETASGLVTAIPNNVMVLGAVQQGTQVTVNFNLAFSQISGNFAELAVAQVVATVAAEDGPGTGVTFEIDGQRTSVPIASGATVAGPVYLLEFITAPH
jgi:spore germination protein GerM